MYNNPNNLLIFFHQGQIRGSNRNLGNSSATLQDTRTKSKVPYMPWMKMCYSSNHFGSMELVLEHIFGLATLQFLHLMAL